MKTTEANPSAGDNAISMTLYFGPANILDGGEVFYRRGGELLKIRFPVKKK